MRYFIVDAFAGAAFEGNPAAVCLVDRELPDPVMAALAREFALSETAFALERSGSWSLRWFSPAMEIPLAGHPTLAAARVLRELGLARGDEIRFSTAAGELGARFEGRYIELDFPSRPAAAASLPERISSALGLREEPRWTGVNAGRNWLIDLGSAAAVRDLAPDRDSTMALADALHGIIVTGAGDAREPGAIAASEEAAFSSRFFAPEAGVFEDPVTGSAHCALAPYWAPILGRESFTAYQASSRGGLIRATLAGDRVRLAGRCVVVAEGEVRPEALRLGRGTPIATGEDG